jgi:hypothetical protein
MTLNDAFHDLTIEQVESALAADATQGFPQDAFDLARLVLRTFSVLAPECIRLRGSSAEPLKIADAIELRIAGMMKLEQLGLSQLEKTASSVDGSSDTRH